MNVSSLSPCCPSVQISVPKAGALVGLVVAIMGLAAAAMANLSEWYFLAFTLLILSSWIAWRAARNFENNTQLAATSQNLIAANAGLQQQVGQLNQALLSIQNDRAVLASQVTALVNEASQLRDESIHLNAMNAALESENNALKASETSLQQEKTKLEQDLIQLQQNITELKAILNTALQQETNQLAKLREECNKEKQALLTVREELKVATAALQTKSDELERVNKELEGAQTRLVAASHPS